MSVQDVLVDALRTAGIATGDAQARVGTTELTGRYAVVWPYNEPPSDGPLGDPNDDRTVEVIVTSCGPSRRAAEQVAEQARPVALGIAPPDGCSWVGAPQHLGAQPTSRETSTDPASPDQSGWYRTDIYRYVITPTGVPA